jgi:Protein of unknown function (DUF1552)
MNKWEFARRDLLKQLGVGLACLPVLHHSRAWAQPAGGPTKKLMIFLASEGYRMAQWKPPVGPLATLPQSCKPLERHKDYLLFLPDMSNPNYTGGERFGHEAYGSIFWGGASVKGSNKYKEPTGSTFEQHIADNLPKKKETFLAFQIQLDRLPKQKVPGGNRCFWRNGAAINPDFNPTDSYARIFGGLPADPGPMAGPVDDSKTKRLLAQKKSILDYVGKSLEKFKTRVAKEDQIVIEQHHTTIRELEGQLSNINAGPQIPMGKCGVVDPGKYTNADILAQDKLWPEIMKAYMNMMLAGVVCDITNVAGLQISDSTGNAINFGAFVPGIPPRGTGYKSAFRNWHDLGHNPVMGGTDHHRVVDEWCMDQFSGFLDKVKAVQQPGGTLLDNSVVLWANHMEDGASHLSQKVPWLIAGKAGGALKTGQCAQSAGKSIQGAMADICSAMGVQPKDPFTGSIPGVRA